MSDKLHHFLPIWDIPDFLKCPVAGAMLSVEKHRSILKKCGYDVKPMKPYEYHQKIMLKLGGENNVSQKVNNFIRNQSARQMARIAGMTEQEIRKLWAEHLVTGDVGPLFYAIVSHKKTSPELLADVAGEVHMQAHANMTEIFTIRRQLDIMVERLDREKEKLAEKSRALKEMGKARKADTAAMGLLKARNRELTARMQTLRPDPATRAKNNAEKNRFAEKIQALTVKREQESNAHQALVRQHKALQIEMFSTRSELELVKKEFHALVSGWQPCSTPVCGNPAEDTAQDTCNTETCTKSPCTRDSCASYRLCAKRIFLVGGITKMRAFYKEVVENAGGEFHYHDGYMKNASTNLEAKVKRCDLVLCPVNCNSHNACRKVKQLCNRHKKPLKILSSSSLFAVSQALLEPDSTVTLN
ncbi:MAG: DUF2325 domain-containing protein [Desulfotignum sp.]